MSSTFINNKVIDSSELNIGSSFSSVTTNKQLLQNIYIPADSNISTVSTGTGGSIIYTPVIYYPSWSGQIKVNMLETIKDCIYNTKEFKLSQDIPVNAYLEKHYKLWKLV